MSRTLSHDDLARFKAQLCDVAERLFAEHGAENVSMRQIAAAMGISPMTPYRYFANREEILAAVRIRGFEAFAADLERAYAETSGDTAAKAMAAGRAYIEFAFANTNTYRLMFGLRQQDDLNKGPLGEAVARARRTLAVYGDGLIRHGIGQSQARAMEILIWSALHGAIMLELAGTAPPGSAQEALALLGQLRVKAP
jgi:AcrR family transcriptional regulator